MLFSQLILDIEGASRLCPIITEIDKRLVYCLACAIQMTTGPAGVEEPQSK